MTDTPAPATPNPAADDEARRLELTREARRLLRETRAGALATLDGDGFPFATLVNVATSVDGAPILLMSTLAAHTRHLAADARASLLLSRGGKGDPLAHPRLTVVGRIARVSETAPREALKARFLARHPKSALYADFADFSFYRLAVTRAHLNGGFARAAELTPDDILPAADAAHAIAALEADALSHLNDDHAEALRLYATRLLDGRDGPWRATGLDPHGLDLALGDQTARLDFTGPVGDGAALRKALADLARRARGEA